MTQPRVCMLVRNDCYTDYRVLKEAASIAKAGYQVRIVALHIYGPREKESRDGFDIVRVPVEDAKTKIGKGINLFPRAVWRMAKEAAKFSADIYHAQDASALLPTWLASRQVRGSKMIYDAHEVGFYSLQDNIDLLGFLWGLVMWFWGFPNKWIVKYKTDAVITVNAVLADLQAEYYNIPKPAVVMNCPPRLNIVPEGRGVLAKTIGVDSDVPIIICQGMFTKERHGIGTENLLRSAQYLDQGVIVLLGWGPQFAELKQLTQNLGLMERVFFVPRVPPTELLNYTAGASLGVIPTEIWQPLLRFSSPNKFFEYLNAGLPVVTSDLPVIRRICDEYNCCRFFDPTSVLSIAEAFNMILKDHNTYTIMRQGALMAAEVYNWEFQEKVLLDVYKKLSN